VHDRPELPRRAPRTSASERSGSGGFRVALARSAPRSSRKLAIVLPLGSAGSERTWADGDAPSPCPNGALAAKPPARFVRTRMSTSCVASSASGAPARRPQHAKTRACRRPPWSAPEEGPRRRPRSPNLGFARRALRAVRSLLVYPRTSAETLLERRARFDALIVRHEARRVGQDADGVRQARGARPPTDDVGPSLKRSPRRPRAIYFAYGGPR